MTFMSHQEFRTDEQIIENIDQLLEDIHDQSRVQFWCCKTDTFIFAMDRFYKNYQREIKKKQWAIFYLARDYNLNRVTVSLIHVTLYVTQINIKLHHLTRFVTL